MITDASAGSEDTDGLYAIFVRRFSGTVAFWRKLKTGIFKFLSLGCSP